MGLLNFFKDKAAEEDKQWRAKELKRLSAQEQRMIDMLAKYTDMYQRGRTKAQVLDVMNDVDKVLGDYKQIKKGEK